MITEITSEQMELLPSYRSKWQQRALSPDSLHRPTVIETLNTAYRLNGYSSSTIFFFDTLPQAIEHLGVPITRQPFALANIIVAPIIKQVRAQFAPLLWTRFWRRSGRIYSYETGNVMSDLLNLIVREQFGTNLPQPIQRVAELQGTMISDGALLDFCISVLGCVHTMPEHWQTVTELIQTCFWHMAFDDICVVLEHPTRF